MSVCQVWGDSGGEWSGGGVTKGHEETFWSRDGFILSIVVMVSWVNIHICQNLSNGTTNYMHFSVFQLYLNKNNCEPNVGIFLILTQHTAVIVNIMATFNETLESFHS